MNTKKVKQTTAQQTKQQTTHTHINLQLGGLGRGRGRGVLEEQHREREGNNTEDELNQHKVRHAVHCIVVVRGGCEWRGEESVGEKVKKRG